MTERSIPKGPWAPVVLAAIGLSVACVAAFAAGPDIGARAHQSAALSSAPAVEAPPGVRSETLDDAKDDAADKVPFDAEPQDVLAVDKLLDSPDAGPAVDLTKIDAASWKPAPAAASAARGAHGDAKLARGADKEIDPEPDVVVTPATPRPSQDPLDKPKAPPAAAGTPPSTDPSKSAAQPETLPPVNAAIKAALDKRDREKLKGADAAERRKEREAVSFFYAAHGFAPAWSENGKPIAAVDPVLARLAHADEDALTIGNAPKDLKVTGTPDEQAASDLAITEAVVAYARQATGSRVDPRAISALIGARPALADPAEVIDGLVAAGETAGDKLQALNPSDSRYGVLRAKLIELRGEQKPEVVSIPSGPTLKIGMHDKRVPLIRSRFNLSAGSGDDDSQTYDEDVAQAITEFQRANGLSPTGTLNKRTQALLSGDKDSKADGRIIANMEMWRWMPRDLGSNRIEVNVPDFLVKVYHDNQPVAENRVVVGKTDTPTPIFSNKMKFLIVNPVWNVPQSIIENEMGGAPKAGFKARYVNGKLYLQQESGPKNALGRIKFMFPNDFSVYLHDTPSKSLFSASRRAFSHGCVRVDKPFAFAESVLNNGVPEGGKILWSEKRLQKMLGDKERYVDLPQPLPIHIEYFTASVDPATSEIAWRQDVYGYAYKVAAALGVASGPAPAVAGSKPEAARARARRIGVAAAPRRERRAPIPQEYEQPQQPPSTFGGGFWGWR